MPMNFDEAEARFRELQSRVQRGEAISRAEYESRSASSPFRIEWRTVGDQSAHGQVDVL